jgi:hypothetical protein
LVSTGRGEGGKKTCGSEADEIDHAVDEDVNLSIDLFVPLFFDAVEELCGVLVDERVSGGAEEIGGGEGGGPGDVRGREIGHVDLD